MKIINPATEELIKEIQEDTKETVETKFQLLKKWSGCMGQASGRKKSAVHPEFFRFA